MKILRLTSLRALLAGCALLTTLRAADSFEGRIRIETSQPGEPAQGIDMAIKGDRMRFDMPAGQGGEAQAGAVIFNYPKNELIILMEMQGQKMFMRQPLISPGAARAMDKSGSIGSKTATNLPAPAPTGRTATIAGWPATEYKLPGDSQGETVEIWFGKGLGNFIFPSGEGMTGGGGPPSPGWEKIARESGFFPLRAITRNARGKVISTFEVTKIERTPLPETLFSTQGYREFNMSGMGR